MGSRSSYDSATFVDLGNSKDELSIGGLATGWWTITVDARNDARTIIGHGQTAEPVWISAGDVSDVGIDIKPLSGAGALTLVVQWDKKTYDKNLAAQSSLVSLGTGENLAPVFDIKLAVPATATYSNPAIQAGYYLLTLRLYDTGVLFWGIVEAVRIVAGQSTEKTWTTTN